MQLNDGRYTHVVMQTMIHRPSRQNSRNKKKVPATKNFFLENTFFMQSVMFLFACI